MCGLCGVCGRPCGFCGVGTWRRRAMPFFLFLPTLNTPLRAAPKTHPVASGRTLAARAPVTIVWP